MVCLEPSGRKAWVESTGNVGKTEEWKTITKCNRIYRSALKQRSQIPGMQPSKVQNSTTLICCGFVAQLTVQLLAQQIHNKLKWWSLGLRDYMQPAVTKLHYFDLLWICCRLSNYCRFVAQLIVQLLAQQIHNKFK